MFLPNFSPFFLGDGGYPTYVRYTPGLNLQLVFGDTHPPPGTSVIGYPTWTWHLVTKSETTWDRMYTPSIWPDIWWQNMKLHWMGCTPLPSDLTSGGKIWNYMGQEPPPPHHHHLLTHKQSKNITFPHTPCVGDNYKIEYLELSIHSDRPNIQYSQSSIRIQKHAFNLMSVPTSGPVKSAMMCPVMSVRIHLVRDHLVRIFVFPWETLYLHNFRAKFPAVSNVGSTEQYHFS